MAKTLKDYKDWIDTYENPTESEKELIDGFKDILDEIFQTHEQHITLKNQDINELRKIIYKKNKELDEKDNHITFLENTISSEIVLRDELIEKLKQNQLKKSDIILRYFECSECESEEFCDDNNLFRFEHDENCSHYGTLLNLDITCTIQFQKYKNLEE